MPRTVAKARAWAAKQAKKPSENWHGKCLVFSRSAYNVDAKYASAANAWEHTHYRHTSFPAPAGALYWWTGGSHSDGHVAVSDGNGYCWTTDFPHNDGKVSREHVSAINVTWTNLRYKGWTEDINDVKVMSVPVVPVLDSAAIGKATLKHTKVPGGLILKRAVAKEVGPGTLGLVSSKLGLLFRRRYRLVQRKYMKAVHGKTVTLASCNGIPGKESLTWLGTRHGFKVK